MLIADQPSVNHHVPGTDFPFCYQSVLHIGIFANECLDNLGIFAAKYQQGFVNGILQCSAQNYFTAIVGLARKANVPFTKRRPSRYIVVNYMVYQEIVLIISDPFQPACNGTAVNPGLQGSCQTTARAARFSFSFR